MDGEGDFFQVSELAGRALGSTPCPTSPALVFFFSWHAHSSVWLPECRSVGWEVVALRWGCCGEETPRIDERPDLTGLSALCSTRSSEARAGGHQLSVRAGWPPTGGPWQCPCPSHWDISDLRLVLMEPVWMLNVQNCPLGPHLLFFASQPQQVAASKPPLPPHGHRGGSQFFPSPWGPSMPSSTTLAGDGRRAVGCR